MRNDSKSWIDEMLEKTGGPLTAAEKAWADAAFSGHAIPYPGGPKTALKAQKDRKTDTTEKEKGPVCHRPRRRSNQR